MYQLEITTCHPGSSGFRELRDELLRYGIRRITDLGPRGASNHVRCIRLYRARDGVMTKLLHPSSRVV